MLTGKRRVIIDWSFVDFYYFCLCYICMWCLISEPLSLIFFSFSFSNSRMPESKPVIGLSWEPKLPILSPGTHNGSVRKSQNQTEASALWRPQSKLVDGLFVPPNDPKKLNKLMKKQLKDTAGKSWYVNVSTRSYFSLLFILSFDMIGCWENGGKEILKLRKTLCSWF